MQCVRAALLCLLIALGCSSQAKASDLHDGTFLIFAPSAGTARIDRDGAPKKQLELGLELGLASGTELVWAGVMLGAAHLTSDDTWLFSTTLRAQAFILGAEFGPALVTGPGGVGTGMRARAFISAFYMGGSTISAAGNVRHRLENTFELGVSLALPVLIKSKTPQISPSEPK